MNAEHDGARMIGCENEANYKEFVAVLAECMEQLHDAPGGAWKARIVGLHGSVDEFAAKMTAGLLTGSADKEGSAVRCACKRLAIKPTYRAIGEYLTGTFGQRVAS